MAAEEARAAVVAERLLSLRLEAERQLEAVEMRVADAVARRRTAVAEAVQMAGVRAEMASLSGRLPVLRGDVETAERRLDALHSDADMVLRPLAERRQALESAVARLDARAREAQAALVQAEGSLAAERARTAEGEARMHETAASEIRAALAALVRERTEAWEEMRALSARQAELRRIPPALEHRATTAEAAAEAASRRQERLAAEVSALEARRLTVRSPPPPPRRSRHLHVRRCPRAKVCSQWRCARRWIGRRQSRTPARTWESPGILGSRRRIWRIRICRLVSRQPC